MTTLRRSMSLIDGAALIVGTVIGSGIFASPGRVLNAVGSVGLALAVWVVGGVLSLAGALCYAELGAALPVSGGEYAYFRKTIGNPFGFLFIWTQFFVMKTGSQAIISLVFATYLGRVIGISDGDWRLKALAIGTIIFLTAINCISVRWGSLVQVVFTGLKLLALAGIIGLGWWVLLGGHPTLASGSLGDPWHSLKPELRGFSLLSAFGSAMISALWAYDGWNNLNYVTEELQEPERNLPKAITFGLLGVMAIYLLANVAYLAVLTPAVLVASKAVATDVAVKILGPTLGLVLIPLAVAASTFGAANGSLLSGSRIFYAAARDGQLPHWLSQVSPTTQVPTTALVVQGAWACCLLALPTDFGSLVDYFGFAAWIFYALAAIAVIQLRQQAPDLPRPYRVWPYPLVPLVFLVVALFLVCNSLLAAPAQSLYALGFILLGLPVYYKFFRA